MAFAPTNEAAVYNDFGFKNFLPDGFEDDEAFWGYVSDARAEFTANPLTFPIPPIQPDATSYRGLHAFLDQPTASTARPLTQHATESVLDELQNVPASTLKDEDVKNFIDQHKNSNTKRKTESDLRKWQQWCAKHGERRELNDIPPLELDKLLSHFFITVRKNDGTHYEPDTLTSFQRSIDRHLTQDLQKTYSILRDKSFTSSREALKAARKHLKSEGKGNKPNAADALEPADVEQLWSSGALGDTDPVTLQQTLWWLIATHMGTRGRDEHRKLRFGDFFVGSTTDGHEYVEFSAERGTKTRTGETEKSTNENARVFKPKMWATPDMPSRCPVRLYQKFAEKRPPDMCTPNSPFYLAVNHQLEGTKTFYWYKKQPLGVTLLGKFMKDLAEKGGIQGKKTNHSARKTMIQTLCSANIPDSTIMQLSGHKSVASLNHYKKPSLEQQRSMSTLLSNCHAGPSRTVSSTSTTVTNQQSDNKSQFATTQGLLSYATFNNCTVNVSLNTSGPTTSQVISQPSKAP